MDHTIVASARRASPFNTQTSIALPAEEDVMKMSEFYYNPQLQQIIQCLILSGAAKSGPVYSVAIKNGCVCAPVTFPKISNFTSFTESLWAPPLVS